MKVAMHQFSPTVEALNALPETIAAAKSDLYVLPELATSPYFFQTSNLPSSVKEKGLMLGNSTEIESIKNASKETETLVILPFFEYKDKKAYNSAAVIDNGEVVHVVRKCNLYDQEYRFEARYFSTYKNNNNIIETNLGKIALFIGEDAQAEPDVDYIITVQAAGWERGINTDWLYLDSWVTKLRGYAILSKAPLICANRFNQEGNIYFWGHSFVADEKGQVVASLNLTEMDKGPILYYEF